MNVRLVAEECRRRRSTTMTTVQFELVLAGLAEGLKVGDSLYVEKLA